MIDTCAKIPPDGSFQYCTSIKCYAICLQGHGIWFVYPVHPLGPSADKGFLKDHEADRTAIYEFDNNVAHSNHLVSYVQNSMKYVKHLTPSLLLVPRSRFDMFWMFGTDYALRNTVLE